MARTIAGGRDVHFYLFSEPDKAIGGMKSNPSITEKMVLSMLDIPGHFSRRDTIFITVEPCITRILSRTITGRDEFFRARVRERDRKCVITGIVYTEADYNEWRGFHAAHIFPLSSEGYWEQNGFSRWITNRMGIHLISQSTQMMATR
ncbi:uncharacterized protein V1513DRAFT_453140 [Lipomyces chichibuensis]|uniref:uncharacterized protein n=1 Tax=Lipomyces chichibuensis TaxID=1546026 RepID=UPI003343EE48